MKPLTTYLPQTPTLHRWLKFNLVGALGMALQLTTLALLNHAVPGHYLLASAAAVELTILHNFLWHLHYTWRDRRNASAPLPALLRFHLSNGLISLVGNLILMRLLVNRAHLPILPANLTAILACSLLNFALGNTWTFPAETPINQKLSPAASARTSKTHPTEPVSPPPTPTHSPHRR